MISTVLVVLFTPTRIVALQKRMAAWCPDCLLVGILTRLMRANMKAPTVMVHAGGDNFSDEPVPLGGGGARLACGVIGFW